MTTGRAVQGERGGFGISYEAHRPRGIRPRLHSNSLAERQVTSASQSGSLPRALGPGAMRSEDPCRFLLVQERARARPVRGRVRLVHRTSDRCGGGSAGPSRAPLGGRSHGTHWSCRRSGIRSRRECAGPTLRC